MLDAILSFACDLDRGVERTLIRPALLTGDSQAHTFRLTVTRGGGDADIAGASVAAYFVRGDGVTVPITGSVEGSVAVVTLPEGCYRVPGRFQLVVKLSTDSGISTVFWGDGAVASSSTDTILDEEGVIPSLDEVLAQIAATEAAAENANSAAEAADTAASRASTATNAAISATSKANAAAASIESIGAEATTLAPGSAATAAWSTVDGAKVLTIGVPQGLQGEKGDKGDKGDPGADGTGSVSTVNGVEPVQGNVTLTAADVGARLDSWVPTAADVGALPEDGTAADAILLGGKAPEHYLPARNLLDNSDFTNPVNQRGQSSWGSDDVYSIDRWRAVAYVGASVSLGDSGITLTHTADGLAEIYQLFERYDDMSGHTYTLAVCVGGVWECVSFVMGDEDGGLQLPSGLTIYSVPSYHLIIRNEVGPESITVERAALYEGEYTADTLPPYVPKGYTAELMECYRYFRKTVLHGVAETAKYIAPANTFEPPFRIVPTITPDTQFGAPGVGGPSASNISFIVYKDFVQEIVDNNAGLTPGVLYRLYIQASADL